MAGGWRRGCICVGENEGEPNDLNCGSNLEELRWCMMKTKRKTSKGRVRDDDEKGENGRGMWKASGNACP